MRVVGIDGDLVQALIKQKWAGGVDELVSDWPQVHASSGNERDPPDRSTIFRWLQNDALPKNGNDFLTLCALLDIDPLSILVATDGDTERAIEHLLVSIQLKQ